jgi:DNA-binding NtrC family response regulator
MQRGLGRILILDDEPSLLRMLNLYLERLGYETESYGAVEDARAAFFSSPRSYRLVVADASMEGVSVGDLMAELSRENPCVRVLAVSGYPLDPVHQASMVPGRAVFLQKPFTPQMFEDAVRGLMAE